MSKETDIKNSSLKKKLLAAIFCIAGMVVSMFLYVSLKKLYADHLRQNERERISRVQSISDTELEVMAQNGDPYAQYALGNRILDMIMRWKAGAGDAIEGVPFDADIWCGKNGQTALNRLQKLTSEGNDYARYSWEEWSIWNESRRSGIDPLKHPRVKPLADFRLLDYSGQLLLTAAETAVENEMHSVFIREIERKLFLWSELRLFFHSPIINDKDFLRRWKAIQPKMRYLPECL